MATLKLGEALYYRLSNYAGLIALTGTRIYPNVAPQDAALPRVTYWTVGTVPNHAMSGDIDELETHLQIDVWAVSQSDCDTVTAQVKLALRDYSGTITSGADTLVIDWIYYQNELDIVAEDDIKRRTLYHKAIEFTVWY